MLGGNNKYKAHAMTSSGASLVVQQQRICLPMQEMWVRSLGQEDPLEKGIAIHSSILAWEIPDRGAWQARIHGVAESDMTELT